MTAERSISEAELHALVDGELAPQERADLEALLAASPPDAGLVREVRELNEAMRARYADRLEAPIPPTMLAMLERAERRRAVPMRRWSAVVAVLLVAVIAGAAGYLARGLVTDRTPRSELSFVANALGAHTLYVPEVRHPVEVKAAEEHLMRWLTNRLGAPVRAPSLADVGWKLMGGRLLPDRGMPAAQFMYEDGGGRRFTLYLRKEAGLNTTSFQFAERDGLGAFYWVDRPLAYALAGKLSREELLALANAVHAQLEKP
jgi:anti-sigma factor RsiW